MLPAVRASIHRLLFSAAALDVGLFPLDVSDFNASGDCLLGSALYEVVEVAPDTHRDSELLMRFKTFASEFAIGCTTHFLLGIAAVVLLGGAAHYWGFSGRTTFVLVAIILFVVAVFLPGRRRKPGGQE